MIHNFIDNPLSPATRLSDMADPEVSARVAIIHRLSTNERHIVPTSTTYGSYTHTAQTNHKQKHASSKETGKIQSVSKYCLFNKYGTINMYMFNLFHIDLPSSHTSSNISNENPSYNLMLNNCQNVIVRFGEHNAEPSKRVLHHGAYANTNPDCCCHSIHSPPCRQRFGYSNVEPVYLSAEAERYLDNQQVDLLTQESIRLIKGLSTTASNQLTQ